MQLKQYLFFDLHRKYESRLPYQSHELYFSDKVYTKKNSPKNLPNNNVR